MSDLANISIESLIRNIKKCTRAVYDETGMLGNDLLSEACLRKEFGYQSLPYVRVACMPFFYKGERIDDLDASIYLIVDNKLLVIIDSFFDMKPNKEKLVKEQLVNIGLKHAVIINFQASAASDMFVRFDV